MDWLDINRIAIVMNFVSFFLIAPEIIGQERLEKLFVNATGSLVGYVIGMFGAAISFFAISMSVAFIYWTNQPITSLFSPTIPIMLIFIVPLIVFVVINFPTQDRFTKLLIKFFATDSKRRQWIFRTGIAFFVISSAIQFYTG